MVLRPCGSAGGLSKCFGWSGLKKIGVKISEVLNLILNVVDTRNVHEILRIACTKNESTKGTFMLNNKKSLETHEEL